MKSLYEEKILPFVQRPGRYIGNELNSVHKDWDKINIKVALSYPDLYEIGMSNVAIQILYYTFNQQPDVLAERVFAPAPDFESLLTTNNLQLTTLESFRPLSDFNLIGISLGHELTYTNIYNILKLGGVPPWQKDRDDKAPLVMGGGPCSFNPEPIVDFFDFFVIGEAEEVLIQILDVLHNSSLVPPPLFDNCCGIPQSGSIRHSSLEALANIPGIYVPTLHNKVTKRIVKDINNTPYPTNPIIPFIETVHDRAVVEIMRGCKWGCKFCQAGWTNRPVRQKSGEKIIALADELLKNTGYEELSLVSLSTSDHTQIAETAKTLAKKYQDKRINISLPSMRTNTFSVGLAKEVSRVRPSGVTLAPEAGTQRLRDVIGKNMSEENIFDGIKAAFSAGIESIKLYFMIGLPTETDEDLIGICKLAQKIWETGKTYTNRVRISVNLATFVPKPHTPLQWEEQIGIAETLRRQHLIKQNVKNKRIEVRWHQAEASFMEGVFARGDSRLSKVIEKAWALGCRLDAWSEYLKFDLWLQAFKESGIDPHEYLKARDKNAPLPWDYIDTGVARDVLLRVANY
ncbi:radical SAM protein [Candidatus Saganbacteria bacterium]|nr:radical SAM protein [Candidatus Saganbacteria bacterium]